MLEQPIPEGLYSVERTHAGAVLEKLLPIGKTHLAEDHFAKYYLACDKFTGKMKGLGEEVVRIF